MSAFTFGDGGTFVAFLIPYNILQQRRTIKDVVGFTSLALYLMLMTNLMVQAIM